jgi:hypothetical protein
MRAPMRPVWRDRGAAVRDHGDDRDAAYIAQNSRPTQVVSIRDYLADQPAERHLIPDDKIALFVVPPVHRLVGHWQGPGTIAQMRRWRP